MAERKKSPGGLCCGPSMMRPGGGRLERGGTVAGQMKDGSRGGKDGPAQGPSMMTGATRGPNGGPSCCGGSSGSSSRSGGGGKSWSPTARERGKMSEGAKLYDEGRIK